MKHDIGLTLGKEGLALVQKYADENRLTLNDVGRMAFKAAGLDLVDNRAHKWSDCKKEMPVLLTKRGKPRKRQPEPVWPLKARKKSETGRFFMAMDEQGHEQIRAFAEADGRTIANILRAGFRALGIQVPPGRAWGGKRTKGGK